MQLLEVRKHKPMPPERLGISMMRHLELLRLSCRHLSHTLLEQRAVQNEGTALNIAINTLTGILMLKP